MANAVPINCHCQLSISCGIRKSGNIFSRFFICTKRQQRISFFCQQHFTSFPKFHTFSRFFLRLFIFRWLSSLSFAACVHVFSLHSILVRRSHSHSLSETFQTMDFSTTASQFWYTAHSHIYRSRFDSSDVHPMLSVSCCFSFSRRQLLGIGLQLPFVCHAWLSNERQFCITKCAMHFESKRCGVCMQRFASSRSNL